MSGSGAGSLLEKIQVLHAAAVGDGGVFDRQE